MKEVSLRGSPPATEPGSLVPAVGPEGTVAPGTVSGQPTGPEGANHKTQKAGEDGVIHPVERLETFHQGDLPTDETGTTAGTSINIAPEVPLGERLGSFTLADLKDELRGRELPVSGTKPELIERLLDDLTVAELKEALRDRELPVSGTKPELVERLQAVL